MHFTVVLGAVRCRWKLSYCTADIMCKCVFVPFARFSHGSCCTSSAQDASVDLHYMLWMQRFYHCLRAIHGLVGDHSFTITLTYDVRRFSTTGSSCSEKTVTVQWLRRRGRPLCFVRFFAFRHHHWVLLCRSQRMFSKSLSQRSVYFHVDHTFLCRTVCLHLHTFLSAEICICFSFKSENLWSLRGFGLMLNNEGSDSWSADVFLLCNHCWLVLPYVLLQLSVFFCFFFR